MLSELEKAAAAPENLHGRTEEAAVLLRAAESARRRSGSALVITGEPGLGRTALLNQLFREATGFKTLRLQGFSAEQHIPLGGVWSLLRLLGVAGSGMPVAPAREIWALLREKSRHRAILLGVDDAHHLDRESLTALVFAARRTADLPVLVVFTAETGSAELPELWRGIRELPLRPLDDDACRRLIEDRWPGELCPQAVDAVCTAAGGNPQAAVELVEALTPQQRAGLAPIRQPLVPNGRLGSRYLREFRALPPECRTIVLAAAVEEDLGTAAAAREVTEAGLRDIAARGLADVSGRTVRVPRVARSVVLDAAGPAEIRQAHGFLARALATSATPDRLAWHRAAAEDGPDSCRSARLARAAERAREHGDYATAARAYEQAARSAASAVDRTRQLLAASRDSWLDGQHGHAISLVRQARQLACTSSERGLAELFRGTMELRSGDPALARRTLREAAEELLASDRELALTALLLAGESDWITGDYRGYQDTAQRVRHLRSGADRPAEQLIFEHFAGMSATVEGQHRRAVPALHRVVQLAETTTEPMSQILASQAAYTLGDAVRARDLACRAQSSAQRLGQHWQLPWALVYRSLAALQLDRYAEAEASSLQGLRIARSLGQHNTGIDHLAILALTAALRGEQDTTRHRLNREFTEGVASRGLARPDAFSSWAQGCAALAAERPLDAVQRMRSMNSWNGQTNTVVRVMAAPHFTEAAAACGQQDEAGGTIRAFDDWASHTGSRTRLALSHRSHALLAGRSAEADEHFRTAIELHRTSGACVELARTELLYAKQLRRDRKPGAARRLLAEAWQIFRDCDVPAWADKARAELRAAGAKVPGDDRPGRAELTPQQEEISRLVAEGATNREIAAHLHISHRTVDYHLRNIFTKLGVRSRVELAKLMR
ncbi:helix-turn-helix transcriptional regulator [Saccharopolyspora rectivirgula]|uniref:HTH luxR-type domain-containing protein n=1 Tax=Saccharopolyspora rectivirgula TaxID=28042 RepID=A0A073AX56_9PSEU|nr:LuxR family transcriptional regulator [Saccharopolyspora rectivirgula]KEI44368.1 hypothetical protein GU90_09275 [Saccharopolyspora rectivirgula]